MKILTIPDVHGSHEWEVIKTLPAATYDYIVFLGDYFDSWENEWPYQGENFKAICDFVREDTAHRKLLLGNHDWSYLSKTRAGSCVSGHQNWHIDDIRKLLTDNLDLLDLAFEAECNSNDSDGRIIFSHAGFSRTWVKSILKVLNEIEENWSIQLLNEKWHSLSLQPSDENFNYEFEELLDWFGVFSGSGNEITQGPLWIRPEALLKDAFYPLQVVGHTEYCLADFVVLREKDLRLERKNTLIMTDSSAHFVFGTIDTENLPAKPMSLMDFAKFYKRTMKTINDIKSQEFARADYSRETAIQKLTGVFGEHHAEWYYRMFFEEK